MNPDRSTNLALIIGLIVVTLSLFIVVAKAQYDDYEHTGHRSIGGKAKKKPGTVTPAPLPFSATPDPNFKIKIGSKMEEILRKHNETFDEFDNTFYTDYDNEFARGALRYKNFEQKDKNFQQEQVAVIKNRTKLKSAM